MILIDRQIGLQKNKPGQKGILFCPGLLFVPQRGIGRQYSASQRGQKKLRVSGSDLPYFVCFGLWRSLSLCACPDGQNPDQALLPVAEYTGPHSLKGSGLLAQASWLRPPGSGLLTNREPGRKPYGEIAQVAPMAMP
jgi:hypothetical protein